MLKVGDTFPHVINLEIVKILFDESENMYYVVRLVPDGVLWKGHDLTPIWVVSPDACVTPDMVEKVKNSI